MTDMAAGADQGRHLAMGRDQGGHQDQGAGAPARTTMTTTEHAPLRRRPGRQRRGGGVHGPDGTSGGRRHAHLGLHDLGGRAGRRRGPGLPAGTRLDLRAGRGRARSYATSSPPWSAAACARRRVDLGVDGPGGPQRRAARAWSSMAISAVDTALWDLAARLLGLPLHRLLGHGARRRPGLRQRRLHDGLRGPALRAQLEGWLGHGIPRVKIKIGESWGTPRRPRPRTGSRLVRETVGRGRRGVRRRQRRLRRCAGRAGRAARSTTSGSPGSRSRSAPTTTPACAGCGTRSRRTSRRASTATASPTSRTCGARVRWTACRSTSPAAAGYTEWLRIAAARRRARPAGVGPLRALAARAGRRRRRPNLRHLEWFEDHVRIESRFLDGFATPGRRVGDAVARPRGTD